MSSLLSLGALAAHRLILVPGSCRFLFRFCPRISQSPFSALPRKHSSPTSGGLPFAARIPFNFINVLCSPLLPSVDVDNVIWFPVYVKIAVTAVFVILTSVPIITQHVIPNPEMKKLRSQCCDCCCCAPCCMGAEYTGSRKGDPKPVWSSGLWRSMVGGISVTFYLSIVQGLVSPLVCSSSGFLLMDTDIVCWSGFHKTIAAGWCHRFCSLCC